MLRLLLVEVDFYWLKAVSLILATLNWFRSEKVVWGAPTKGSPRVL